MMLFKQRQEKVDQQTETDLKNREESIKTLTSVTSNPKLSPHHKAIFAETMREVSVIADTLHLHEMSQQKSLLLYVMYSL